MKRIFAILFLAAAAKASEHSGTVLFAGMPVPGVTVTATRDAAKQVTTTGDRGLYRFADLADGEWTLEIQMTGFAPITRKVTVAAGAPPETWELKTLPLDEVKAEAPAAFHAAAPTASAPQAPVEPTANAAPTAAPTPPQPAQPKESKPASEPTGAEEGFLINGSTNNGAASPFAQFAAFGNSRGGHNLYNGGIGITGDSSIFDARAFSLTGQDTAKPSYTRITGLATLGGPIKIPHLLKRPIIFFIGYQWTRNSSGSTATGLVPTAAERGGDLSQTAYGGVVPANRISPQALALLALYPLPNFAGSTSYNYQVPLVANTHEDAMQSRLSRSIGMRDSLYGRFAFQDTRSSTPSLFDFLDGSDVLGLAADVNWNHRFGSRVFMNLAYAFSRLSTRDTAFFQNRENISGLAGIAGNNQSPVNWGPPALTFSSGIASLTDGLPASDHNQTSAISDSTRFFRGRHDITVGADFRRQQFNYLGQQNPRGSFGFTGVADGSDLADFLLGAPDTSAIAFGNADKYFRQSVYDAYVADDWRVAPELTVNVGVRWEYGAPITELYGRLVNLDVAPGFSSVAPVVGDSPVGSLTGLHYPSSLIRPDKRGVEPRVGIAWRPLSGSSTVVRTGYGVYYNTSVYENIATQMAQQAPLSKSFSVSNSSANPLTLADGFNATAAAGGVTFGIDPNFRAGYAQIWQVSVQRDLPWSLQMVATYLGIKGTRGMQEFLPNTAPSGSAAASVCLACPSGYLYLTSNGNSSREAAQIQLRRRLHSGLTATLQYVFSKSIDDDSTLGGLGFTTTQSASGTSSSNSAGAGLTTPIAASQPTAATAQNWLDLAAERSRSSFDQRHSLTAQIQYTSGMGMAGGTLLTGWRGAAFKEWTVGALITAASGLPETPIVPEAVGGTGFIGSLRPDYTGAPLYAAPAGLSINPAAYTTPLAGQWGNAGRYTITGPAQFGLNASLGRTFRVNDKFNLDFRLDSTNMLNHVAFTTWNTTVGGLQFGLPVSAGAMRSVQTTLRLRF